MGEKDIETEAEKQRNRVTEKQRNRETEKQRNTETEKQRDSETEKQRNRETEKKRKREVTYSISSLRKLSKIEIQQPNNFLRERYSLKERPLQKSKDRHILEITETQETKISTFQKNKVKDLQNEIK